MCSSDLVVKTFPAGCMAMVAWVILGALAARAAGAPLPGTAPLEFNGDPAAAMVAGIDRWLDRHGEALGITRSNAWAGADRATMRGHLRRTLGLGECVASTNARLRLEMIAGKEGTASGGTVLATGPGFRVSAVSWEAVRGVRGEGLLLEPSGTVGADVVWLPDCDVTPEAACGLGEGANPGNDGPAAWASMGCRVLVLASKIGRAHV